MKQNGKSRSQTSKENNQKGTMFENAVLGACAVYLRLGQAKIFKVYEPFKVLKLFLRAQFKGLFLGKAEPDFSGTLLGGMAIHFEAKITDDETIKQNIVSEAQFESLEYHYQMGAIVGVVASVHRQCYFIPWELWRSMKEEFDRQYLRLREIEQFRVKYDGTVLFLDFVHENWIEKGLYIKKVA